MSPSRLNLAAVILIVAEACIVCYLSFVAWLMSGWMADDSWAFRATDADWLRAALTRFSTWVALAAGFGVALWFFNRWLSARGVVLSPRAPLVSGVAAAALMVLASGFGSVQFLIERPWM